MAENPREPTDDEALRARLDRLSRSLDGDPKAAPDSSPADDKGIASAMNLGFRVLTELVAGVGVGALIGWQLDKWFKTSPLLLIVFLTLGTVAGFWNVYRVAAGPTSGRGGRRGPL